MISVDFGGSNGISMFNFLIKSCNGMNVKVPRIGCGYGTRKASQNRQGCHPERRCSNTDTAERRIQPAQRDNPRFASKGQRVKGERVRKI